MPKARLGVILVRQGLITEAQLSQALAEQCLTREFLGEILVRRKFLFEADLLRALSTQFGLPVISLTGAYVDWELCLRYAGVVGAEKKFLPFREEDDVVTVAIHNPLDVAGVSRLEDYIRPQKIRLVLVSKKEFEAMVAECVRRSRSTLKNIIDRPEAP
jgi:hypothetical protein